MPQHRIIWTSCGSRIRQEVLANHVRSQQGSVQDRGACRASRDMSEGTKFIRNAEAEVPYSTAGKSVVCDEGRRFLVSKDGEGELMTIESRQAEVRRSLTAINPMSQQVCFWPDRAGRTQKRHWQSDTIWKRTQRMEPHS